jgi:hypothetical protein
MSQDEDLSFVIDDLELMFRTDYLLEGNARQFLNLDKLSLLMVIGDAFSVDGVEKMSEG